MVKDWCADVAHWLGTQHLRCSEFYHDVEEWLTTSFTWGALRERRAKRNLIFDDPDIFKPGRP